MIDYTEKKVLKKQITNHVYERITIAMMITSIAILIVMSYFNNTVKTNQLQTTKYTAAGCVFDSKVEKRVYLNPKETVGEVLINKIGTVHLYKVFRNKNTYLCKVCDYPYVTNNKNGNTVEISIPLRARILYKCIGGQ